MLQRILRLRFIYLIAVVVTFINSLFFLAIGVKYSYYGYMDIVFPVPGNRPGLHFVESLDMFMIALVFLIFSLGMMRIFVYYHEPSDKSPSWIRLNSFKELKVLLWETILLTLVIISISDIIRKIESLTWEVTIIPVVILALSLSLMIMRKNGDA